MPERVFRKTVPLSTGENLEVDMSITITGRQFDITPAIKQHVEDSLNTFLADATLKVTSINVVMDRHRNQFTAGIVLSCKYHVLTAKVEDFDLYRAFDHAVDKIEAQCVTLRERIHNHKAVPLSGSEIRKAAEETDAAIV